MKRTAVIGAGPAGLAAAYELVRGGAAVDVFEADASVGGLGKSLDLWGRRVDLGSHIFIPHDARVASLWSELIGNDYRVVPLRRGIWSRGRIFDYPMQLSDVLLKLGLMRTTLCALGFLASQARRRPRDDSAESWIVNRFGRPLFDLFFREYAEKLWGLSCQDVDAEFAVELVGNVQRPSVRDYFRKRVVQAAGDSRAAGPPGFQHPRDGIGELSRRMAAGIESRGGAIHLSTRIERLSLRGPSIAGLQLDGKVRDYDWVVSSIPLPLLIRALPDAPAHVSAAAKLLKSRNTILVYLLLEARQAFPYNWLYVYSPRFKVGRITNFGMWRDPMDDDSGSIVSMEYWCSDGDDVWSRTDADIVELARGDLAGTGLCTQRHIRDGHVHRIRAANPVYERGYKRHVADIRDFVASIDGLLTIGRHGAFSFNSVGDSMLAGLVAAQRVLASEKGGRGCVAEGAGTQ
jgi:protoporphyrinogen oxidase